METTTLLKGKEEEKPPSLGCGISPAAPPEQSKNCRTEGGVNSLCRRKFDRTGNHKGTAGGDLLGVHVITDATFQS